MRQCPTCKTTYTDDSLVFCLNDGTSLISVAEPPPTQVIPPDKLPTIFTSDQSYQSNPTVVSIPDSEPNKNGKGLMYALLIVGFLVLIGVAGIAALLFYNNEDFGQKNTNSNNSAVPSPTSSASSSNSADNTQELKNRLANLEKQLNEEKNTKSNSTTNSNPFSVNSASNPKNARVASSNDGFLAMRSAPSTQSGKQILKIPTGATVEVKDCKQNMITIGSRRGRWCLVSYGGETGWVFDAWLVY